MSNQTVARITKELAGIQKGSDLSLAVACEDEDVRNVKALIIGTPNTPYEHGFFEFIVKFGSDYPNKPPKVDAKTTNNGRCRFNPNIYAGGKVCLSILGTWQGEKPGEEWSSAQGLESVLWSIQSLMSNNPYENEPGFEHAKSEKDKRMNDLYCAKIQHETLRIAVIQMLERVLKTGSTTEEDALVAEFEDDFEEGRRDYRSPVKPVTSRKAKRFEPFKDLYKRRFLWYYECYLHAITEGLAKHHDGKAFEKMPFEGEGNIMKGGFEYTNLLTRLNKIKEKLDSETSRWAQEGLVAKSQETGLSANLIRQFEQLKEHQRLHPVFNVDLDLDKGNPFVWLLTYFGPSDTNLDGGIFRIRISISTEFPEEQPRVKVETPVYHHRVAKDGTLCYVPQKTENLRDHVHCIISTLQDKSPPFDPRTNVHPEATKLFWGSAEDKKKYNRLQRRSAARSVEEG